MLEAAKLRELCLHSIFRYIRRFLWAYESGDPVLMRNFEYLQRVESQVMLKQFLSIRVPYHSVEFFLNCYLKKVIAPSNWDKDAVQKQLLVISSKIAKLRLPRCRFSTDYLCNLISKMPNVTELTLCLKYIEKPIFKCIRKCCPSLETLNLCCKVTDELIKTLCEDEDASGGIGNNESIQKLNISKTSVTTVGVAFVLQHFPNLKCLVHESVFDSLLELHGADFENNSFNHLKPYKLANLSFPKQNFDERVARIFSYLCPHLINIIVKQVPSIVELSLFPELTNVCISGEKENYVDLSHFIETMGKNLELVILTYCDVSIESLLRFCPKLKCVRFYNVNFELPSGSDMSGYSFQHMESVGFDSFDFSIDFMNSVVLFLTSTPNLKSLHFTFISDIPEHFTTSYTEGKQMKSVVDLDVSGSDFNALTLIRVLRMFPNLRSYTAKHTVFSNFDKVKRLRPLLAIYTDHIDSYVDHYESDEKIEDEDTWMNKHDCRKFKAEGCAIS